MSSSSSSSSSIGVVGATGAQCVGSRKRHAADMTPCTAGAPSEKRRRTDDDCAEGGGDQTTQEHAGQWFGDSSRPGPPCTYNKYLSVMAAVKMLGVKEKRELFKLMREGDAGHGCGQVNEHTFLPRLGVTVGEFALFYVLADNPRASS